MFVLSIVIMGLPSSVTLKLDIPFLNKLDVDGVSMTAVLISPLNPFNSVRISAANLLFTTSSVATS
ncbi:MAG: hypothetical protein ISR65_05390 [Bacteriovoracaceae bacterium]|nr:hypothetical protein [Bacteriovoracaceae bacterium]